MVSELLIRFALGGLVVSAFAAVGELFKPKTFVGLFGAPSVALATLALAFSKKGPSYVAIEARAMLVGSFAILVYCAACTVMAKREAIPVWFAAGAAWITWLVVGFAGFQIARAGGML